MFKIPPYVYLLSIDPDTLMKYTKLTAKVLRFAKKKAKKKGMEHRKTLAENEYIGDFFV